MARREPQTLPELQAEHRPAPRGRFKKPRGEVEEHSAVRNYVRDLILGFNDGLVSVYAIVAGVVAAGLARPEVVIAGVAATVAGAISMGLGEYLSTKSQTEYYAAEAERERDHIRKYPQLEREEVHEMLAAKHYPAELVPQIAEHIMGDEDRFVDFMMREEFGVGEETGRSPFIAMGLVMVAFVVGAAAPLLPFLLGMSDTPGLLASSLLALGGLFAAGAARGKISGLKAWKSGLEMAALGAVAAAVTYGVGALVGIAV